MESGVSSRFGRYTPVPQPTCATTRTLFCSRGLPNLLVVCTDSGAHPLDSYPTFGQLSSGALFRIWFSGAVIPRPRTFENGRFLTPAGSRSRAAVCASAATSYLNVRGVEPTMSRRLRTAAELMCHAVRTTPKTRGPVAASADLEQTGRTLAKLASVHKQAFRLRVGWCRFDTSQGGQCAGD